MQEPIISPWLIYLANVSETLSWVSLVGIVIAGGAALIAGWVAIDEYGDMKAHRDRSRNAMYEEKKKAYSDLADVEEKTYKSAKRIGVIFAVIAVISLVVTCLVPSKETCYQMIAAHYLTYENVDAVGGQAKEVVDYIFDKVDEVSSGEKEDE